MSLPSSNTISFPSKEAHQAALYDACMLIVNTYRHSDLLDGYECYDVTSFEFMRFARHIANTIAQEN